MEGIRIRRLTAADIAAAAALEKICLPEAWSENAYRSAFEMDGRNAWFWCAEHEGELIGLLGLFRMGEDGEIGNVAVLPAYRRRGLASRLLETAMNTGRTEFGLQDFTLEVRDSNAAAAALYEAHGFRTEGIRPRFYRNPEEAARIMWKRESATGENHDD